MFFRELDSNELTPELQCDNTRCARPHHRVQNTLPRLAKPFHQVVKAALGLSLVMVIFIVIVHRAFADIAYPGSLIGPFYTPEYGFPECIYLAVPQLG